jgi:hypothetical protein
LEKNLKVMYKKRMIMPVILAPWEAEIRRIRFKARSHLQNNQSKMDWKCGSGLLCKLEALTSNPRATKKQTNKSRISPTFLLTHYLMFSSCWVLSGLILFP